MATEAVSAPDAPPVHPVDEVLAPAKLAIYGAQHVLAFYAGAVIVPILLAAAIGVKGDDLVYLISADLFTCGIASIIQAVGFKNVGVRLPLLQGVTFTAVAPMIAIGNANGGGTDGLLAIYGATIVAGAFAFVVAPYFSRLLRLFPPVVTGTVILVIGVALLPVAAQQAGGGNPADPSFGSFENLELAGDHARPHHRHPARLPREVPRHDRGAGRARARHDHRDDRRRHRLRRRRRRRPRRRHDAVSLRAADVRRRGDRLDDHRDDDHGGRDDRRRLRDG